ncbi:MAG: S-layer homology domain-containing protein [Clostridia bacterium]|nr:S-layer homology domain-containing protein [Clostridia bacterium]
MKSKKFLSLLMSIVVLFSMMVSTTLAEDEAVVTEKTDVYAVISTGIASSEAYINQQLSEIHDTTGVSYGFEWYVITMLRAQKAIDEDILDEYYGSLVKKVKEFDVNTKPTDLARTALALLVMNKDITNIDGVNLIELIYNNEYSETGSNDLAYALIVFNATELQIPENAKWNEHKIITELLKYQAENGGFGLTGNAIADIDVTAICIQALSSYQENTDVNNAVSRALEYLKGIISSDYNYSDNPNSTAQVLMALSSLKIDVTDINNGFGSETENIITALGKYSNNEGSGYLYENAVNSMATVQVMQAYDAYRKAHKENLLYWDFTSDGEAYDDKYSQEGNMPDADAAESAEIYVTIASDGNIVTNKNGEYVAHSKITVTDINTDGKLTVDEALYAAHEEHYEGGAEEGYSTFYGAYGLSLSVLWGKGTKGETAAAGYYLNNESCWSMEDVVKDGDYLTAFNYYDTTYWSDAYSYFSENDIEVEKGKSVTLQLNSLGYDSNYSLVVSPCSDAKVVFLGSNNSSMKTQITDKSGNVKISFKNNSAIGSYYVMAYKEDSSIVPAISRIKVVDDENSSGNSKTISVNIKVADPKGNTYLKKTSYKVEKGTTVFELLEKTGLDIDATHSAYGDYVNGIEGLAEFDEGTESGWMYSVNNKFPNYSASLHTLSNGDYVEWLYTRNFGKDIGKSSLSVSSGGVYRPKDNKEEQSDKSIDKVLYDTALHLYKTVKEPQIGSTGGEWTIIALARSGMEIPDEYYLDYYKRAEEYVKLHEGKLHNKKYTEYSRLILALTAIGKNPSDVAGYNLLMPLGDYEKTVSQGLNGAIWALIALDSGNYDMPQNPEANVQATREMYINHILEKQTADGGWALSGEPADIDVTAMALQALSNYQDNPKVKSATDIALNAISRKQDEKGGFSSWGTETSENCVQTIVALCELGISLDDERFVKNKNTILDRLICYYTEVNGFKHSEKDENSNLMATEQALYGLVSIKRLAEGKNSLYDMSDAISLVETTKEEFGLAGKHSDVKKTNIVDKEKTFADILGHKNQTAIEALVSRGIINGKTINSYEPNSTMTRAEFTAIVTRGLGLSGKNNSVFSDVDASKWYYDNVNTARFYGIIKGLSENTFNPNGKITREEAAVMISRASELCGIETEIEDAAEIDILAGFGDYTKSSVWARESLAFCYDNGILSSELLEIKPKEYVTRAEIADMFYNMLLVAKLL